MHWILSRARAIIALAGIAFLAGCYKTSEPVLDTGERVPYAGTFICRSPGGTQQEEFKEEKSGLVFPSYAYLAPKGERTLFKNLTEKLYLAQIQVKEREFILLFADFSRADTVSFLAPLDDNVAALAKKYNIRNVATGGEITGITGIAGTKADILAFIQGHNLRQLMPLASCQRKI
jgi:hypothetical protein